jgi:hypothetical protein
LGAEKNNNLLKNILDFYEEGDGDNIWTLPIFTMPQIFEHFFIKMYDIHGFQKKEEQEIIKTPDITIYPERYFIPFRYGSFFTPDCVEEDTCTIHWFGGSWTKPEVITWLMNKHINPDTSILHYQQPVVKRYKLIGKTTLLKTSQTSKECKVSFLRLPLFKVNDRAIYLFNCVRILKRKP